MITVSGDSGKEEARTSGERKEGKRKTEEKRGGTRQENGRNEKVRGCYVFIE